MYRAAVIGGYDSIYGFASVGMRIIPVANEEECVEAFRKACGGDYAVLFITENYAAAVNALITAPIPAVMYIPSQDGGSGFAKQELHRLMEKAAGADLLS